MKNKSCKKVTNLLLVGMLCLSQNINAQEEYYVPYSKGNSSKLFVPKKRAIYVNEQDQIIKIVGNSSNIPYKEIKVFRGEEEIKMNAQIDYQYNLISPTLDFNKNKIYLINLNPLIEQDCETYSNLELKVINLFYDKGIYYPGYQIVKALKKSGFTTMEESDTIRLTVYPEEGNNEGYEKIEIDLIR